MHLLRRHGRPVAEERLVRAHVRRACGRFPSPDLDRTDYLVVMGANPHASQGSLLAAPDVLGEIDAHPRARRQGGRDRPAPHRHGRARRRVAADPSPAPTPRSCSRSAHVLFAEGLVRPRRRSPTSSNGVDEVRRARAATSRPRRSRETCGIPADDDPPPRARARGRAARRRLRPHRHSATRSSARSRRGSSTWSTCSPATSTAPGGAMFAQPDRVVARASLRRPSSPTASTFGRWHSRVRGAPEVLGQVPISCLAEEIATPGAGQLRALITIAGNPVISAPDAGAARRGAARARVHDQRRQLAERDDAPRARDPARAVRARAAALRRADLVVGGAQRGQRSPPPSSRRADRPRGVGDPARGSAAILAGTRGRRRRRRRDSTTCFFAALVAMVAADPSSRSRAATRTRSSRTRARRPRAPARLRDPHRARGATATAQSPDGLTLESLADAAARHRHGPARAAAREICSSTPSGKIELAPDVHHRRRPAAARAARSRRDDGLVLVEPPPPALEQLVDAQRAGARHGQGPLHAARPPRRRARGRARRRRARARHAREAGSIEAPVEVSDEMMPGVVCLPHGWGHDKPGTRMAVAASTRASTTTCSRRGRSSTCSRATRS